MAQWRRRVESLVFNPAFWSGRRVFLTGHTGFKGAWMSLLLRSFGAQVSGFSLEPESRDGLFNVAGVQNDVNHRIGDIRDLAALRSAINEANPDILIHMAAQALVRQSYLDPIETYSTNVMGTVNVLEVARPLKDLRAIVVVSSDKCYENAESRFGFRETDAMGGHDPYSSSKGCTELVSSAYRRSFFQSETSAMLATARAGNVIGGGDWSRDRLVPDIIRAFIAGETVRIRNPRSVRPWQHVLDPLIGYLLLAQNLVEGGRPFEEGWNFGPNEDSELSVADLVQALAREWGSEARWQLDEAQNPHEANFLKLDCSKARSRMGWRPLSTFDETMRITSEWYRAFHDGADMRSVTLRQIELVVGQSIDGQYRNVSRN